MVNWDSVSRHDVDRAMEEYDRLGAETFFANYGFAPTTTYELVAKGRRYPPKATLGRGLRARDRQKSRTPVTSRAARAAPSACWKSSDLRSSRRKKLQGSTGGLVPVRRCEVPDPSPRRSSVGHPRAVNPGRWRGRCS